eukprot:7391732-Prymnesium_polylepis.6
MRATARVGACHEASKKAGGGATPHASQEGMAATRWLPHQLQVGCRRARVAGEQCSAEQQPPSEGDGLMDSESHCLLGCS